MPSFPGGNRLLFDLGLSLLRLVFQRRPRTIRTGFSSSGQLHVSRTVSASKEEVLKVLLMPMEAIRSRRRPLSLATAGFRLPWGVEP